MRGMGGRVVGKTLTAGGDGVDAMDGRLSCDQAKLVYMKGLLWQERRWKDQRNSRGPIKSRDDAGRNEIRLDAVRQLPLPQLHFWSAGPRCIWRLASRPV